MRSTQLRKMSNNDQKTTSRPTALVWFRLDLRLTDNPAWEAACTGGVYDVIPVFIWSPDDEGEWRPGAASKWWLHHSLTRLDEQLREKDSRLVIRQGSAKDELSKLVEETHAVAVFWNRRYEPLVIERDKKIKEELKRKEIEVQSFNGSLLFEPWEVETNQGSPYQVFTPFWKSCLQIEIGETVSTPRKLRAPKSWPDSLKPDDLNLLPKIEWDKQMREFWEPGCEGARKRLKEFVDTAVAAYGDERNFPDRDQTSRLSPHLHFGEISPREVWHEVVGAFGPPQAKKKSGADVFLSEVVWREFAYHLMYHFPETTNAPLREKFDDFPWREDEEGYQKWCRGNTGYPIVDAGMRQLWALGWMHNRVRMIVASFLCKDQMLSWQQGAEWFWDTLVDADLASNTLGWQWTAGCGADAAPYFRVFNPILQSQKFDKEGKYIREWIPELAELPTKWLHEPFNAPDDVLEKAGVTLGEDYPRPIVDHKEARERALEAFEKVKG